MKKYCNKPKLSLEEAWQILLDNIPKIRRNMFRRLRRDLHDDCINFLALNLTHIWEKYDPDVASFRDYLFSQAKYFILNYCNQMTRIKMKAKTYNFNSKVINNFETDNGIGTGVTFYAEKDPRFIYENKEYFDFQKYSEDKYGVDEDIVLIVAEMSKRHRVVFILKEILDYDYTQIAEILGVPKSRVQTVSKEYRNYIKEKVRFVEREKE